jgi:hypothetical protein
MKTHISTQSHRPEQRYSGVFQQQGRMLLDADANELVDILNGARAHLAADAVGDAGAPRDGGLVDLAQDPPVVRFGEAWVGGTRARLLPAPLTEATDPYLQQADFHAPPARPDGAHVLYLDVWERPVDALEDPVLLDPALHGADTATRTQTMAQLKWCPVPAGRVPPACEDPALNPGVGTATIEAELRAGTPGGAADPCDPCADELDLEVRLENGLFRLEVHDVDGPPTAPTGLVLKWSGENAAERYPVSATPPGFLADDRVYELYGRRTGDAILHVDEDRHLGVHLAPGFEPARGRLLTSLPAAPDRLFVRRWDGCVHLERAAAGDDWTLATAAPDAPNVDRGVALQEAVSIGQAHGAVVLGTTLELNLQELTVRLDLDGKAVVAGDYWLVLVREREREALRARPVRPEPLGPRHAYLTVGRVTGAESFALDDFDTADRRRFGFPPLSDVQAADVGYGGASCQLLRGAGTVEQALDALCGLGAQHVAYANPGCANRLLSDAKTVQAALDAVCRLDARRVPYTGAVQGAAVGNVWDALDLLSARGSGDVGDALLALFGRGVVCGLLPTVTATTTRDYGVVLTATTTTGAALHGRGGFTRVAELALGTAARGQVGGV